MFCHVSSSLEEGGRSYGSFLTTLLTILLPLLALCWVSRVPSKVLEVLKEAHEWLCKENEEKVRKTLEERGWLASFDLQPDVPFPERK